MTNAATPPHTIIDYHFPIYNNSTTPGAQIEIRAASVGRGHRHTYIIFCSAEGEKYVLCASPGNTTQLSNPIGWVQLDAKNHENICVQFEAYKLNIEPETGRIQFPIDWDMLHSDERRILWTGTNEKLYQKMKLAITTANQINTADFEYSPLLNNGNNVTSTILTSISIQPCLPFTTTGQAISAPAFNTPLYQNIGLGKHKMGYSFDGKYWIDSDGITPICPPTIGEPFIPTALPQQTGELFKSEHLFNSENNIETVNALYQKLHHGIGKQIEQAGAGKFTDSMVAECAYHCIEKAITADNVDSMHVDTNQNKIIINTKNSEKSIEIDAIQASRVDPVQRLHEATQLFIEKKRHFSLEPNQQFVQYQDRQGPKLA